MGGPDVSYFAFLRKFDGLYAVFALWLGATALALACARFAFLRLPHATMFPPMFIAGMVAYKLLVRRAAEQRHNALPRWAWPFFVLGLFALQAWLMGKHHIESPNGVVVDACICLTLGIAIPAFGELQACWIARPSQQVAKYSYGIYLLHIPALTFVLCYLPEMPLAMKAVLAIALTALLSFVSFHFIEDPLIRLGKRLTQVTPAPCPSTLVMPREGVTQV